MNKNKCALLMLIALCASGCSFSNFLSSPASSESSKLSETSTVNSTPVSSEVTSSSTEESSSLPESSSSVEESSSTEESSSLPESSSSVEESSTSTANVDQETVDRVKSELTFPTSVKNDFNLPSEIDGVTITYLSSDSDYLEVDGTTAKVYRPSELLDDEPITLTASFRLNSATATKEFDLSIEALEVTNVVVTKLPNQTNYNINATNIDLTGGLINVTLDNNDTKEVALDLATVKSYDFSTSGEKEITCTYAEFDFTFKLDVITPISNKTLAVNETVIETFEDKYNPVLSFDNAQTPNSKVVKTDKLGGEYAYYFESAGSYACVFINGGVNFENGATYEVSFKYVVESFVDTLYFQYNWGGTTFTQFGGPASTEIREFKYVATIGGDNPVIQIFPGATSGKTAIYIDDIQFKKVVVEENETVNGALTGGQHVKETFGDPQDAIFEYDNAEAPNSSIKFNDSFNSYLYYFESNGNYAGAYLKNYSLWSANSKYKVEFDYYIEELNNEIYYQMYNGTDVQFKSFGGGEEIQTVQHFEWEFTTGSTSDVLFKIFPGAGEGKTSFYLDNLKVTKIEEEVVVKPTNVKCDGVLESGQYVLETLDDNDNKVLNVDLAPTADTSSITAGFDYNCINLVSGGNYAGFYLTAPGLWAANAEYTIEFDYKVISIDGALYIKVYSDTEADKQLEASTGQTYHGSFDFSVGASANAVLQMFPNAACNVQIDNIKITRK